MNKLWAVRPWNWGSIPDRGNSSTTRGGSAVTLWIRVVEVISSILIRESGYTEIFYGFPQILPANVGIVPRLSHKCILQNISRFCHSTIRPSIIQLLAALYINPPSRNHQNVQIGPGVDPTSCPELIKYAWRYSSTSSQVFHALYVCIMYRAASFLLLSSLYSYLTESLHEETNRLVER